MATEKPSDLEAASVPGRQTPSPERLKGGTVTDTTHADAALSFLRTHADARPMSAQDEKRLLRKIDWMVMPLMWLCYMLQYLDKTLINYANVMGLSEDANLTETQFSTLALIFYVSYLGVEFPHGYAMQKLPTAKYLGAMVTIWGACVTVTAACKDYGSLVATRVLLGVFESAVAPSLILITTMWSVPLFNVLPIPSRLIEVWNAMLMLFIGISATNNPPRVGLWYLGTGSGMIFGSLLSFGFQHYTADAFTSWQIMFLVVGLVTVVVGICVFIWLPDNPMKSRLTQEEKVWAIERLRENQTGIENTEFKSAQVLECFTDPQSYLLCLITIATLIPNGAVSSYQATLIKGFGFDSKTTALLSIPSGVITIISILCGTYLAGRYNIRGFQIMALLIPGILGGGLMAFLPEDNQIGKLIGNYLTNVIGSSLPLLYSWVAANYAGHTKKVTMNALLLIAFCVGNIIGPLTFTEASAPEYIPAKITILVVCAAAIGLTACLQWYYVWENKRRRELLGERGEGHREDVEFADLTDRGNLEFLYQL